MKALIQLFILNMLFFSCTSNNTEEEQKKNEDLKETKSKTEKVKSTNPGVA